jgi:hypothetical protein
MRVRELSSTQRKLLDDLAGRISVRLEAHFVEIPGADDAHIGVSLQEAGRTVVIDLPVALLAQAIEDPGGREVLRTRLKARRDRMMFQTPPRALPKTITPMFSPGPPRGGFRGGRR